MTEVFCAFPQLFGKFQDITAKGAWTASSSHQGPQPKLSPMSQRPSPKAKPYLWIHLPDLHSTKVLIVKGRLPDRFIFLPMAIVPLV
jgi:hypothetical protein